MVVFEYSCGCFIDESKPKYRVRREASNRQTNPAVKKNLRSFLKHVTLIPASSYMNQINKKNPVVKKTFRSFHKHVTIVFLASS